ncbi:hypothetical protein J6590_023647 [Homalodisca vitripennis]|nr:hypothetical protein J6590_023647 [Homalodisca vitripennis]
MAQLQQTTAHSRSISHIDLYNTGSVHQMHVPYVQSFHISHRFVQHGKCAPDACTLCPGTISRSRKHCVLIGYTDHGVLLGMAQLQQTTAHSRSISHIDLYNTGSVHQMHVPYVQVPYHGLVNIVC